VLSARGATLTLALVAALAAPATAVAKNKGHKVGGKVRVSVPAFNPSTGTSLATGFIRSKKNCEAARIVRFAFFNADGTPVQVGQPAVVTDPSGHFIAALPNPGSSPGTTYIVKVAVDARKGEFKGKTVHCRGLRGPSRTIAA
jgi:hypothetical protein